MPDGSMFRTVLGDVRASEMGACYAHEHVIVGPCFMTYTAPEFLRTDIERVTAELCLFRAAGGATMVDSMPCGGGRSIEMVAEVSRRTGVHIVCPTGLHLRKYYPPGHWSDTFTAEAMAAIFVREIEEGIDLNDTNGPCFEPGRYRAGLIKVASGLNRIDDYQKKVFTAAAMAQRRTLCPILTHTEQGTAALEQVDLFRSLGVAPEFLILSHTDRKPDPSYHREILSTGVFLEYDSAFRWKAEQGNPTRELLETLCAAGYSRQLLVGMDAARSSYWRSFGGGPGIPFLLETFFPKMVEEGFPRAYVDRILVENPARAYARFGCAAAAPEGMRPQTRST